MVIIGKEYSKDECTNPTPQWLLWGGVASGIVALVGVVCGLLRWHEGWFGDIEGGKYMSMLLLGQMTCCQNFCQMIVLIAVIIASILQQNKFLYKFINPERERGMGWIISKFVVAGFSSSVY